MTDPGVVAGLGQLDRLLEHRVRLAVVVLLSRHDFLSFTRLRELTGETDGGIGAHLRRLETDGYLDVSKTFRDRKPLTRYALTPKGRSALTSHLRGLEALLRGAAPLTPTPDSVPTAMSTSSTNRGGPDDD